MSVANPDAASASARRGRSSTRRGRRSRAKLDLFCGTTELTGADVAAPHIAALVRDGDSIELDTVDLQPARAPTAACSSGTKTASGSITWARKA